MKPDRHNYEEYFLLYVDNELSADEMKEVELFVRNNPDLEAEFVMLQQAKLPAEDPIVFDNKDQLFRINEPGFDPLGHQESLLLYIDGELDQQQRLELEALAGKHPAVQTELELLAQTRLGDDRIEFPWKESLYKKEHAVIFRMQWFRVAVAAMLIAGAGFGLYALLWNSGEGTPDGVKPVAVNVPVKKAMEPSTATIQPETAVKSGEQLPAAVQDQATVKAATSSSRSSDVAGNKTTGNTPGHTSDQTNLPVTDPSEDVAKNTNDQSTGVRDSGDQKQRATVTAVETHPQVQPEISDVAVNAKQTKNYTAPVTIVDTYSPEPKYADNENKRLRGFFRKATRIIEHTTRINPADDDNKVLIGGMAINLR